MRNAYQSRNTKIKRRLIAIITQWNYMIHITWRYTLRIKYFEPIYYLCGMGLFSFSKNKNEISWKNISSMEQLDEIEKASFIKTQIIFKHSTTCSISRMAKNRMEDGFDELEKNADVYYLDLLAYRNISNAIADKWKIEHESPQVLVIKGGKVIYHASHNMIKADEIQKQIA